MPESQRYWLPCWYMQCGLFGLWTRIPILLSVELWKSQRRVIELATAVSSYIWVVLSSECLSIESWIIKLESASFRQSLRVTYDVYSSEWKGVFYLGYRQYGIRTQKMSTHCWHHHFFGVLARKTLTSCRYEGSDRKCEWWCPRLDAGCMYEPTEWMDQKLMSTPDPQKSCDKDSIAANVYSFKIG